MRSSKLILSVPVALSAVLGVSAASAADLAVKAPIAPVATSAYSWAGFYIGGNVGYSWGRAASNLNADPVTVDIGTLTPFNTPGFVGSDTLTPKGVIGGGQIGYNWQTSPNWVFGVEADLQASGEKASRSFSNAFSFTTPLPNPAFPVSGVATMDYTAKITWFGTVRGRVGYAWDRMMLYATGGLAYGGVNLAGTNTVSGTVAGLPFLAVTAIGHSQVNAGWTVGAGVEGALGDRWTWKAEYLYLDLGSMNDPDLLLQVISASGGRVTTHTDYTDNIIRLGLNYRLN
jgi:outer membrane immunogenic protein